VHCCEQTGVGNMLNEFVHTPLAHSVLMLLTTVQSEPKAALPEPEPEPEPGASTDGVLLLLQATDNANAKNKSLPIAKAYQRSRSARNLAQSIEQRLRDHRSTFAARMLKVVDE
jgi:hypothetical protein